MSGIYFGDITVHPLISPDRDEKTISGSGVRCVIVGLGIRPNVIYCIKAHNTGLDNYNSIWHLFFHVGDLVLPFLRTPIHK